MCSISDCSRQLIQSVTHDDVEVEEGRKGEWLLELAANNDVRGLQAAVEKEGANVNECGRWYCRQVGSNKMGLVERSPIMIAALFGSLEVLEYILAVHGHSDYINKVCSADKSTVLHCAMASGASNTSQMVHLLLSHGADPSHVDSLQGLCQFTTLENASLNIVTPSPSSDDADIDWNDVLPDSVSVTSLADLDEIWGSYQEDASACPLMSSSPKSEKAKYNKTFQDHSCDIPLSSDILRRGIYTTDEFRMYSFKVRPCSRAYSHDWTECPFVHPGENARRRDPRRFHYSCVPCPDFRKGACRDGDACEYAHGVFESWLHPAQYRTRLCKDGMSCTRKVCFFAHTKEEVRPLFISMEYGATSPRLLSPVDVASTSSPGGAASPSAALRMASFSPIVTNLGHPSFASSDKSLYDSTWTQPSLPTLHLPEGAQASRLTPSLSARDINSNGLPDVDGQLMAELASLSAQAWFNAAVAASSCSSTPSNNGMLQNVGLNFMSNNVEDLSPRSPLQMCLQFSPQLAAVDSGRVLGSTAMEDLIAAGVGSYPRHCRDQMQVHKLRPFQQSELGCRLQESLGPPKHTEAHQRSPLSGIKSGTGCDWGCPTGKKPEWGVSGDDPIHFRNVHSASPKHKLSPVKMSCKA